MGRKLMSAVLFGVKFLKVHNFQYTCALSLVIASCFALLYHSHCSNQIAFGIFIFVDSIIQHCFAVDFFRCL
jgi:hypothetical protein